MSAPFCLHRDSLVQISDSSLLTVLLLDRKPVSLHLLYFSKFVGQPSRVTDLLLHLKVLFSEYVYPTLHFSDVLLLRLLGLGDIFKDLSS